MKIKRAVAYLIDFLIVYIIAAMIFSSPLFKDSYSSYQKASEDYFNYIIETGSEELDYDIELQHLYDISKYSQPLMIINSGLIIIYFGIIVYMLNGQTLGKKIMKLKVVSIDKEKLNPNLFMLRAIILTNLLPKIASIISLALLGKTNWIIAENIITFVSNSVLFLIIGCMIFRDDERGLHDVICKTDVISTK